MRLAFYGSSLVSSYWNGAATYYRGLLEPLAALGWRITFYEPDAFDRQAHRDIEPPSWARSIVYPPTGDGLRRVLAEARRADVVVKASGVGIFDEELLAALVTEPRADAVRVFWDVDAPATLAELRTDALHKLHAILPELDMVLTYGGGAPVTDAYRGFGAAACWPIYNALDPSVHFPVAPDPALRADLAFLANRMPDREERAQAFFFAPAGRLQAKSFLLGGSGWDGKTMAANVRAIGHVGTERHNAFNCSATAILNVARDSMAEMGFCPATRVFEAAGAGACLITDHWEGIELFLQPNEEVLVARDGQDVVEHLASLTPERAKQIGARARNRVLTEHTYALRARIVDRLLRRASERRHAAAVA